MSIPLTPEHQLAPQVQRAFDRIVAELHGLLPDADVEHIGATAIPGALTKGDLDVVVRVAAVRFQAAVDKMKGAFGVKQPQNWNENFASFGEDAGYGLPLGIQLVARDSEADFFCFLRDYLIEHPDALAAYNQLKTRHAGEGPQAYWKAKHIFFSGILAARMVR